MPETEFFIPSETNEFADLLGGIALRMPIHRLEELQSGSKITDEQFALLRTYFPPQRPHQKFEQNLAMYGLKDAGGRDYWEEAGSLLDQCKPFNNFVAAIDSRTSAEDIDRGGDLWTREFTTVLRFWDDLIEPARESAAVEAQASGSDPQVIPRQLRKARYTKGTYQEEDDDGDWATDLLETKKRRLNEPLGDKDEGMATDEKIYPPGPNEAIVNMMLVALLKELASLVPNCQSKWTVENVGLKAKFGESSYTAWTDGCLRSKVKKGIQAIIEASPRLRSAILELTRKQEAGELSAFFHLNDGELPNLRG